MQLGEQKNNNTVVARVCGSWAILHVTKPAPCKPGLCKEFDFRQAPASGWRG